MRAKVAHPQIPLSIGLNDSATFDTFYCHESSANSQAVNALKSAFEGGFIYLWGSAGSGCSHLLQAFCNGVKSASIYLPLDQIAEQKPTEVLPGLDHMPIVVLDRIDAVIEQKDWAEQIFHLYNRLQEHNRVFLVAADCAPRDLQTPLADLQSRLSSMQVHRVQALSDEEKTQALIQRAAVRGMEMSTQVAEFLLTHYSRDMADQMQSLDVLDKGSLAAKRKLTIPLVKELLGPVNTIGEADG